MYYNQEIECISLPHLKHLQKSRLIKIVEYCYNNVSFYNTLLKSHKISPTDIKNLNNFQKIPFTTKDDIIKNYPFGFFAVPIEKIARIHTSSGTRSKPKVVGYTKKDLEIWAEDVARTFIATNAKPGDKLQNAFGYGLFTGGLGFHQGAQKVELTVIPTSTGNTKRQANLLLDLKSNILACTPSYAMHIGETLHELGINKNQLNLKSMVAGAEILTEGLRNIIQESLGAEVFDTYGLSEIIGPGVAFECTQHSGLHINEDHYYAEIIDPDSGQVLPLGEEGELVLTTLLKEGMPLLRYQTNDITSLKREKCQCGRTFIKMSHPKGRTDDMVIIRGVNVYPSQIEQVLADANIPLNYQIVIDRVKSRDTIEVIFEDYLNNEITNQAKKNEKEKLLEKELKNSLGLIAKATMVEHNSIERSCGKAKRLIDKRIL